MIRQLIRSYVLLVAVAIALFTVPVAFTLTNQLRGDTELSVKREAETMAKLLGTDDVAACEALTQMAKAYTDDDAEVQVSATNGCGPEGLAAPVRDAA